MKEDLPVRGYVTVKIKRANGNEEVVCENKPNLLTTAGRDWIHSQVYNSGTTDEAKYIALSSDNGAPAAGDTSVVGEIVTADLARKAGTYNHTASGAVTTIAASFTATGTITAVQKSGLFSAVTGGTLVHENTFTSVNMENSDIITITWTITT